MSSAPGVELPEILAVFTEVITRRGGQVTDSIYLGSELEARSVLPRFDEARPGDRVQAGVALRATESEVYVHPYLFRLLCHNGATMVAASESRRLANLDLLSAVESLRAIREAVVACCTEDAFTGMMLRVSEAAHSRQLGPLEVVAILTHFLRRAQRHEVPEIHAAVRRSRDRTYWGLVNAITSVARDTRDHRRRWDLEELGGAVLAGDIGVPPHRGPLAARATSDETAKV